MSETALAQYSGGDSVDLMAGLGSSEQEALKPSSIILVQKPENGTPGSFKDTLTQFEYETIQAVPISFYSGRVLFPEGAGFGEKPLCRSNDGKSPVINDDLVRQDGGAGCAKCPSSQWKKINGKTIKPACMETASLVFIEPQTEFLYRLNVKGTGIIPTRNLRESLRKTVLRTKALGKVIPPFGFTIEISSTKVTGRTGTYYVVNYGPPNPIQDDEAVSRYYQVWDAIVNKKNVTPEVDPVDEIMDGEYIAA